MRTEERIHDAFDRIEASEELKASTKDFLRRARQQDSLRHRRHRRPVWRPGFGVVLGTVCLMLVCLLGTGGYVLAKIPVSYVSIDVNPSIELALNRFDRVIYAAAYNRDGENVLNTLSLNGMRYNDAVDAVMESDAMQPYLSAEAGLTFTVAAGSGRKADALQTEIASSSGCLKYGGTSLSADIGIVEEAHENGLSTGKYAAYQVLRQYDGTVTVQDCHDMTMAEIYGLIQCHKSGHENDQQEKGHKGEERHGHGHK